MMNKNQENNITFLNQSLFMDDLDIQAYIDDELSTERRNQVWKAIKSDPLLMQRYKELEKQKELILMYWKTLEKIH